MNCSFPALMQIPIQVSGEIACNQSLKIWSERLKSKLLDRKVSNPLELYLFSYTAPFSTSAGLSIEYGDKLPVNKSGRVVVYSGELSTHFFRAVPGSLSRLEHADFKARQFSEWFHPTLFAILATPGSAHVAREFFGWTDLRFLFDRTLPLGCRGPKWKALQWDLYINSVG